MKIESPDFNQGELLSTEFAFGRRGDQGEPCVLSANRNPGLRWSDAPPTTRSFVLLCVDPDVPSKADDVNQPERSVPADLPRVEFAHWLMIDIPPTVTEIARGACSDGVSARGKRDPGGPSGSRQGINDYTSWFAGDADMGGDYYGYDGPCPPWNDNLMHRYFFRLYALDVERLDLPDGFRLADVYRAMQGHVLAEAATFGRYSLNPKVEM
ncbi:YbhB/YbcL family Raf kinase inhibitor-like protein [Pseudomarimonas arenosa]|uniref:YbhB/YbcL family Raf kinase inhibitor-like protein n=1 Tax=Pseudomarimonas arenosa TaxID=2774145 RepID=A0AAW3ZMN8_9GAMM|nr:YbhB/YbcL family Raf kinase inhibitor-like protein [Pseudomarimonas arenosa]MBD8526745.1 YbhB/YbcL family Raf kinase inhibitor-like protein [Pseudomarimonas arenosa]